MLWRSTDTLFKIHSGDRINCSSRYAPLDGHQTTNALPRSTSRFYNIIETRRKITRQSASNSPPRVCLSWMMSSAPPLFRGDYRFLLCSSAESLCELCSRISTNPSPVEQLLWLLHALIADTAPYYATPQKYNTLRRHKQGSRGSTNLKVEVSQSRSWKNPAIDPIQSTRRNPFNQGRLWVAHSPFYVHSWFRGTAFRPRWTFCAEFWGNFCLTLDHL